MTNARFPHHPSARAGRASALAPALAAALLSTLITALPATGLAQSDGPFDPLGNLVEMPFEHDLPIVREITRQDPDGPAFVAYTSAPYETALEHYRQAYADRRELAPGWTVIGYAFDVGVDAMVFIIRYADQRYRMEIRPDEETGGAVLILKSGGAPLGYEPFLYTVMPYRPIGLSPIPFNDYAYE